MILIEGMQVGIITSALVLGSVLLANCLINWLSHNRKLLKLMEKDI